MFSTLRAEPLANPYLCILVRCKGCQRTERSRSIQGGQKVPSPPECPSDPEGREARRSQRDPRALFVILLVALRMGERGGRELKTPNLRFENFSTAQLKHLTKAVWSCGERAPPPHPPPPHHPSTPSCLDGKISGWKFLPHHHFSALSESMCSD